MSSYYSKVDGTLKTGQTARADDIHLIQSSIQRAIQNMIVDILGTNFILGEDENALKLYATNNHIDQTNLNYNDEGEYWISFYDTYVRQPIDITKSSIETVSIHMLNETNLTVTVYAEIRNNDFELIQEANAILEPTKLNSYTPIDFHFKLNHLPIGRYYFVIRPVDISATDLTINGDETPYDTIEPDYFCVKFDSSGRYNQGLELSVNGETYLQASTLGLGEPDGDSNTIESNPDLYFEEIYSSRSTYLINDNAAAVVLGEKVYPLDTHVTINDPSNEGNRTDLVTLTTDGQLIVTEGEVYTDDEERKYPTNDTGLKIAYITNFKASENKVPAIEQDDDDNITRQRDILERLRRLEKRMDYQVNNNSPTRIKYNCEVDPILANNGVDKYAEIRGEGTYNIGTSKNANGNTIATSYNTKNYAWSIIHNNYTYNVETKTTENGEIKVWDTFTTKTKDSHYIKNKKGLFHHHIEVKDHSESEAKAVSGLKLKVQIKKGATVKKNYTVTTNKNGEVNLTLFSLKLTKGTYSIYTIYGSHKIKSKLTVVDSYDKISYKEKSQSITLSLPKVSGTSFTQKLPEGVISGDDSFYKEKIDVDTTRGEVRVSKISNISDTYEVNEGRKLLKDMDKQYDEREVNYILTTSKKQGTSHFPALHVTFNREVYIKSLTPYIEKFQHIKSIGILIFKNDIVYGNKKSARKTYTKTIGAGAIKADKYDDATFPTLYKSKYISLKNLTKKSGDYQVLKKPLTFDDINLDLEAGTYTIMICPKLASGKSKGQIVMKEYETKRDTNIYGTSASCSGNSKMAKIYMDTAHLSDRSWDVAIEHKTYRYYDKGVLISQPVNVGSAFSACSITKNFIIPKNCNIKLFVSNNGGTKWWEATKNHVNFESSNSSFRWKIEMETNSISTPKLKFNNNRKYAISFTLATSTEYVSYEDYHQCYETPLMNANAITRNFTKSTTKSTFSEWEFARLFIEDEELNSRIDILISYVDDDYATNVSTAKENWNKKLFFSTVFADLTLDDFNRDSIDYDNYDGNVEYDEYNYRFLMQSEDIMHYTGGVGIASPDVAITDNSEYIYGDISESGMGQYFTYKFEDGEYTYYDNDGDSRHKYSGMHIEDGPYWKATYSKHSDVTTSFTNNDPIIGVRFVNGLDVDENMTHLTIGLIPYVCSDVTKTVTENSTTTTINNWENIKNNEEVTEDGTIADTKRRFFPEGTFKIAISLSPYGIVDDLSSTYTVHNTTTHKDEDVVYSFSNAGKEYVINKKLYSGEYNEVTISFLDDLEGFEASQIQSIALKLVNPSDTFASMHQTSTDNDYIGIGRITTSSYNRRPYVPYMYTGKWDRLKWKVINTNTKCQAFAMYKLGRKDANTNSGSKVFYPIDNTADNEATRKITTITELDGNSPLKVNAKNNAAVDSTTGAHKKCALQVWGTEGTSRRKFTTTKYASECNSSNYIKRNENEITTVLKDVGTFKTKDSGNQILFKIPAGITGDLFKINTNIPYTIYDLIDIEYYIFTRFWKTSTEAEAPDATKEYTSGKYNIHKNETSGHIYETFGSFSKGELYIDMYDTRDITNAEPVESFALPSWGRIATKSEETNKVVHAWFKKRSNHTSIKCIVLRRANPRKLKSTEIKAINLVLNDIIFFNAEVEAALGPQMQMRIYPNNMDNLSNTKIRKYGGVYRI